MLNLFYLRSNFFLVFLKDAAFSGLDATVAHHVFEEGILKFLLQKHKTVVITSHQTDLLRFADKVSLNTFSLKRMSYSS